MTDDVAAATAEARLEQIRDVFERDIQPRLASHLGGGKVVGIDDEGVVEVEFTGACTACAYRRNTIVGAIYPRLREIDGVHEVRVKGVAVTAQQQQRAADQLSAHRRPSLTVVGATGQPQEGARPAG